MNNKKILIYCLVLALFIAGFYYVGSNKPVINSFIDCMNYGYPVMESYPRQCKTEDGRTFAEEITPPIEYKNSSKNLIEVELPYPGAVTGKKFSVIGKARGVWFFEASFPIEVLDKDGKVLVVAIAQAKEDWMTESFVPFEAIVEVPQSYIGPATLVLKKDNPSGESKFDASISFPITIEY